MNILHRLSFLLVVVITLIISSGCEKEKKSGLPTDGDGNTYDTVRIGTQVWLAENLKTTKLQDGRPIKLVKADSQWEVWNLPAYCWYDNDSVKYKDSYGALYNWYAGKLEYACPVGYHVPTKEEWTTLAEYMKSATEAEKQSFKVRNVGMRVWNGSFQPGPCSWWASVENNNIRTDFSFGAMPKGTGYSVRCIKNN